MFKRMIAMILCIAMLFSMGVTASADTTTGVLSLSSDSITTSSETQTVVMTVTFSPALQGTMIEGTLVKPAGWTLSSATFNDEETAISIGVDGEYFTWLKSTAGNGEIAHIDLTMVVPANVEPGNYTVGIHELSIGDASNDYPVDYEEYSTTITVTAPSYTVIWEADGATYTTTSVTAGGAASAPATDPTKDGYTFDGWYLSTDTEQTVITDWSAQIVNAPMTYVAKFTVIPTPTYTVTYAAGDHAAEGYTAPAAVTEDANTIITLPEAAAAADGWEFAGWNDGTTIYTAGADYTVTADVTLTATWDEIPVNPVVIDLGGDSYPWIDSTVTPMTGTSIPGTVPASQYYYSSNAGAGSTSSTMTITVNPSEDGMLSFDYLCSGETSWDELYIGVNGTETNVSSTKADANTLAWASYVVRCLGGEETVVTLRYKKDGSGDHNSDRAYLSNIKFGYSSTITPVTITFDETKATITSLGFGDLVSGETYDLHYMETETLIVRPMDGIKFTGWYDGDTRVSTALEYEITGDNDYTVNLEARFAEAQLNSLTVTFNEYTTVIADIGGVKHTLTSGEAVPVYEGRVVTVDYSDNGGYAKAGIYQGGTKKSDTGTYTYTSATEGSLTLEIQESYRAVSGYTAPEGLTVVTETTYPWTNTDAGLKSGGARKGYQAYSNLAVIAAENGIITMDRRANSYNSNSYGLAYGQTSEVRDATGFFSTRNELGYALFYGLNVTDTLSIPVSAGDVVFFVFRSAGSSTGSSYGDDAVWLSNITFTAQDDQAISVTVEGDAYGSVTVDGVTEGYATFNAPVTLTAVKADADSVFDGWFENDTLLSTDLTYSFRATEAHSFVAKFHGRVQYDLSTTFADDIIVTATVNGGEPKTLISGENLTLAEESEIVINASGAAGSAYAALGVYNAADDSLLSATASYSFVLHRNTTLHIADSYSAVPELTVPEGLVVKTEPAYPWVLDSDGYLVPTCQGINNGVSQFVVFPDSTGFLTFEYKASSEGSFDVLYYKTGEILTTANKSTADNYSDRGMFSGNRDWQSVKIVTRPGVPVYLAYIKDSSGNSNNDTIYIRNVGFQAGSDYTISAAMQGDPSLGSVSVTGVTEGIATFNALVTVTATKDSDAAVFDGWYEISGEDETLVSMELEFSFNALADRAFVAKFHARETYTLNVEFADDINVVATVDSVNTTLTSNTPIYVDEESSFTVSATSADGATYISLGVYDTEGTRVSNAPSFTVDSAKKSYSLQILDQYQTIEGYTVGEGYSIQTTKIYSWAVGEKDGISVIQSGNQGKGSSVSEIAITAEKTGKLYLEWSVESEAGYDYLLYKSSEITTSNYSSATNYAYYKDYGGSQGWTALILDVTAGDTVFFAFRKDSGGNTGADTAWIKDIGVYDSDPTITVSSSDTTYGTVGITGYDETAITPTLGTSVTITATVAEGGQFYGWYKVVEGVMTDLVSRDSTLTFPAMNSVNYRAMFNRTGGYEARIESTYYETVEEALASANSGNLVILVDNADIDNDVVVPTGVTLLIPYGDSDAALADHSLLPVFEQGIKDGKQLEADSYTTPSAFRTLTVSNGAQVTVNGTLLVDGKLSAKGQSDGTNGVPSGPSGRLVIYMGGGVTVANGGKLSVWGYATAESSDALSAWNSSGSAAITIENGGTLREALQIRDWRGGTNTSGLAGNQYGVFPFSQYYVQNIELPLRIDAAATELVQSGVYVSSSLARLNDTVFIGEGGMFTMDGGYLVRRYDATTDRTAYDFYGNLTINGMTVNISVAFFSVIVDSRDYVLPINSSLDIAIHSGTTTFASAQEVGLLPGCTITVDKSANLNVPNTVIVYDSAEWVGKRCVFSNVDLRQVKYIAVRNAAPVTRNAATDAQLDINGTLTMDGALYTTVSGANITSGNGTGSIVLASGAPEAGNTYQSATSTDEDLITIPITPAKLLNADGSYTLTAGSLAGDTFYYANGFWAKDFTITFDKNSDDAAGTMDAQSFAFNADPAALSEMAFTAPEHYHFAGWAMSADGEVVYADKAEVSFTPANGASMTLYAVWEIDTHTVTFADEDGTTVLQAEASYLYGTEGTDIVKPADPTKAATAQYNYIFSGWSDGSATYAAADIPAVTADVVYKAVYTQSEREYAITWVDGDGNTLKTETLHYNVTPVYTGATPTKTATTQFTYSFNSKWSDTQGGDEITIPSVTGDATYYALFDSAVNEYTITFVDEDGTTALGTYTMPYGDTPEYDGEEPEKEETAQYIYTFVGWSTDGETVLDELPTVTGDATYTAVYEEELQSYMVTWVLGNGNDDEAEEYEYGETPSYEDEEGSIIPIKLSTAQYDFTFIGWMSSEDNTVYGPEDELPEVSGEVTYTAQYSETLRSYTITFVDENGTTVLNQQMVNYGETPVYAGEGPSKASTTQYTYTFGGWDPTVTSVTGDATYTATYTQTVNQYTVTWFDEDGTTVLDSKTVDYGTDLPAYSGAEPAKTATAQYTYSFDSWATSDNANIEDGKVIGPVSYTATYSSVVNQYTVTWYDENGTTVLGSQTVDYGTTVPTYAGETPTKEGNAQYSYTFDHWDTNDSANIDNGALIGNVNYTAVYTESVNEYTVTWMNYNGTETYATETVAYGQTPAFHGTEPTRAADATFSYTFIGWNTAKNKTVATELSMVTANVTYYAAFSREANVSIRFAAVDVDGSYLADTDVYPFTSVYLTRSNAVNANYTVPAPASVTYYKPTGTWIIMPDNDAIEVTNVDDLKSAITQYLNDEPAINTVTVAAQYERMMYTINFFSIMPDGTTSAHGSYPGDGTQAKVGKSTIVTAPSTIGNYQFDHWIVDGKTYYSETFSFMPTTEGEYNAYAYYVEPETTTTEEVSFRITQQFAEQVGSKQKIGMTLEVTVPDGYTIENVGFKYTTSTSASAIANPAKYSTSRSSMLCDDITTGTYTLRVVTKKTVHAFAYLDYTDANGEAHTLYAVKDGAYDPAEHDFVSDTLIFSELF